MSWQDFMFVAIGISILGLSGALVFTLSKTWPILDHAESVSQDLESTTRYALRGPITGILKFVSLFTPKGGEENAKQKR